MNREQRVLAASDRGVLRDTALLVVVLLIATFFRAVLFEAAPPGLQHDEIFKANFALDILDGGWPVFFDANGGEEALFPYLAALSISLFGPNFFALRFVSLVCAILSIALSYRLVRELFGGRVAVLVAATLAVSFWHVFDSRVALRPITLLVTAVASFYLYWLALRTGRILWFALAGLCLGLSFHTYTSGFLIPVTILVFLLLYQLPFQRDVLRRRWQGILLALVVAVVVALPMLHHVYTHPQASTARARDLSDHINLFLAGEPGPLVTDVFSVLGMFGLRGDPEWRYNLAGRPVFEPVTFALFCGGVIICLRRIKRPEYAFLLVWLCINVVPASITRNSPSTLRAIGSLTAIYVLPALTLDLAFDWVGRRFANKGTMGLTAAVIVVLAGNALWTYWDYFHVWADNAEVRYIYRADLSAVARYLEESVTDEVVCVSAEFAADLDQQVLYYMMGKERPIRWFDGQQTLVWPQSDSSEDTLYVFPATSPLREDLASRFFSDLPVAEQVLDPRGEPAFVAYRLSAQQLSDLRSLEPVHSLRANLEDRVELLGYDLPEVVVEAGGELPLSLFWRVAQPIRPDLLYSFFTYLVDSRGYAWDQIDTLGYPVSSWIEGDEAVQVFTLTVPPDAPPLEYTVSLGMYDQVTGVRLTPVLEGRSLPGGAVSTAPFSVTKAAAPPDIETLDIPRERYANFEDKIELLGCDLETIAARHGEAVQISLYWQALVDPQRDYMVSVLITDEAGEVLDEIKREPVDGLYPTSLWSQGEVLRDRFAVTIDQSMPEGRHRLWVRLWDPDTSSYLRLVDTGEDRVRVGKVYVTVPEAP